MAITAGQHRGRACAGKQDARRFPRQVVSWLVTVSIGSRQLKERTKDTSAAGAKILIDERLSLGSQVLLQLRRAGNSPVETHALVWRLDADGFACVFVGTPRPGFLAAVAPSRAEASMVRPNEVRARGDCAASGCRPRGARTRSGGAQQPGLHPARRRSAAAAGPTLRPGSLGAHRSLPCRRRTPADERRASGAAVGPAPAGRQGLAHSSGFGPTPHGSGGVLASYPMQPRGSGHARPPGTRDEDLGPSGSEQWRALRPEPDHVLEAPSGRASRAGALHDRVVVPLTRLPSPIGQTAVRHTPDASSIS